MNDSLYQVLVNYDRDRTAGLTNDDIIQSLSVSYGTPVVKSTIVRTDLPAGALDDAIVLAQWSDAAASLTLLRGTYSPDFQLVLISKTLGARARSAATRPSPACSRDKRRGFLAAVAPGGRRDRRLS